jgi:hypothetical protein
MTNCVKGPKIMSDNKTPTGHALSAYLVQCLTANIPPEPRRLTSWAYDPIGDKRRAPKKQTLNRVAIVPNTSLGQSRA